MQTEPVTKTRKAVVTKSVPARKRAKRLPAEKRRHTILAAAMDLFATHGFDASTRDLAETIGVRQTLIYRHFESKDALIVAVLKTVFGEDGPSVLFEDAPDWGSVVCNLDNAPKKIRLFLYAGLAGYIKFPEA